MYSEKNRNLELLDLSNHRPGIEYNHDIRLCLSVLIERFLKLSKIWVRTF